MNSSPPRWSLVRSLWLALLGILAVFRKERNIKIHSLAGFLAVVLGLAVGLDRLEWLILILLIFTILAAETFNTAIEKTCDLLKEKLKLGYEETKAIRDISAGAVLLLAIVSVILGMIIFFPHLFSL